MKPILNNKQMQQVDRIAIEEIGIPSLALMESAGRAVADIALKLIHQNETNQPKRVFVLCGTGNNGGDGFVAARHLMNAGVEVWIRIVGDRSRITGDAYQMLTPLLRMRAQKGMKNNGEIEQLEEIEIKPLSYVHFDLVIDALLGTGLRGELSDEVRKGIELLQRFRDEKVKILAVDIPSGLSGDTGKVHTCCAGADVTVTFASKKIGQIVGKHLCGELIVHDIGIPPEIAISNATAYECEDDDLKEILPNLPYDAHKGTRGKVFILAGSVGLTGAATLTANAAVRMGAGLVTVGAPETAEITIASKLISAMSTPLPERDGKLDDAAIQFLPHWSDWAHAWAIGPGIGRSMTITNLVKQIYTSVPIPMVVDADALFALSKIKTESNLLPRTNGIRILTPHLGEFALLVGLPAEVIAENRIETAGNFAKLNEVILVLKGSPSIIATPEGKLYINPTGNYALATGGSGDVLTGMIVAILARMKANNELQQPELAAVAACYLHGLIADKWVKSGKRPDLFHSQILLDELPNVFMG